MFLLADKNRNGLIDKDEVLFALRCWHRYLDCSKKLTKLQRDGLKDVGKEGNASLGSLASAVSSKKSSSSKKRSKSPKLSQTSLENGESRKSKRESRRSSKSPEKRRSSKRKSRRSESAVAAADDCGGGGGGGGLSFQEITPTSKPSKQAKVSSSSGKLSAVGALNLTINKRPSSNSRVCDLDDLGNDDDVLQRTPLLEKTRGGDEPRESRRKSRSKSSCSSSSVKVEGRSSKNSSRSNDDRDHPSGHNPASKDGMANSSNPYLVNNYTESGDRVITQDDDESGDTAKETTVVDFALNKKRGEIIRQFLMEIYPARKSIYDKDVAYVLENCETFRSNGNFSKSEFCCIVSAWFRKKTRRAGLCGVCRAGG